MTTSIPFKHIPYLDGWRGLAILLVMQSHFGLGGGGRLGVALFFALSGYLMGELLFVKNVALPGFFKRRFSRVVPTFWLYVAVAFILATWLGTRRTEVSGTELVSALLFLRTYFPADVSIWAERWPIGHFWSLNVEEHSYLFLAALALLARRAAGRQVLLLVATTVLCLLLNCWYTLHPPAGASPWFARSECAALGLVAAATLRVVRHRTGAPAGWVGAWVTPATLVLAAVCFTWPAYPILQITLGPLLLAVSINFLDCAPAPLHRALSLRPLRWFGICSFSMYIWQQLFYDAYLHGELQRQVAGVLAVIVATAAFYLYEDPVRRRLNNGSRKASGAAPAPVMGDEDPLSSGRRSMM